MVQKTWCPWRWHNMQNRQRSHMFRWKSMMKVSVQSDREDGPRRNAGQVRNHQNAQLVVQAATVAATDLC